VDGSEGQPRQGCGLRVVRTRSAGPLTGVLVAAVLGVPVLAGCGGGTTTRALPPAPPSPTSAAQKPAPLVLKEARDAFVAASAVRVKGSVPGSGNSSVAVDLRLAKGKGAVGSFTVAKSKVDVVRIGATAYLRGDDAFLARVFGDPARAAAAKGRWVKGPVAKLAPGLAQLTDQTQFARIFDAAGSVTADGTQQLAGRPALRLRSSKGALWLVTATGKVYPLRITRQQQGKSGALDFTDYGKLPALTAPKDAITLQS